MNKKIIGLIILGVFFVGSATYALFNEDFLLNDVTSDIQTNDTSLLNIQNNQSNNIPNIENLNLSHNIANVLSNDIGNINGDVGQKIVKEVYRFTVDNKTFVEFDDSSFIFRVNNVTYNGKHVLTKIYDVNAVAGGYIQCFDCSKFIPVGDVSGLVPDDYLCDCGAFVIGKNVSYVYSEESVLEHIKITEDYYKDNGKPLSDSLDDSSTNIDNIGSSNGSDEKSPENIENTISQKIANIEFDNEDMPFSDRLLIEWIKSSY